MNHIVDSWYLDRSGSYARIWQSIEDGTTEAFPSFPANAAILYRFSRDPSGNQLNRSAGS